MKKKKIPYIEVKGSNYDIGYAAGELCKRRIRKDIKLCRKNYPEETGEDFNKLLKSSKRYLLNCKKRFPSYVDELNGMAKGADAGFDELFILNCEEEFCETAKCTTIAAVTKDKRVLIGHNEDWADYSLNDLYIIKAKQKNKPDFLSLAYGGTLPGSSVGLNSAGIAFSGNAILVGKGKSGVLKNFLLRSILDTKTVNKTIKGIKITKRAIGDNLVIADKNNSLVDVEVTPKSIEIIRGKNYLVHANHLIGKHIKYQEEHHARESVQRYNRAMEIFKKNKKNIDFNLIKKILKDHKAGICGHFNKKHPDWSITIASVIVDLKDNAMYVAHGNPCKAHYHKYTL